MSRLLIVVLVLFAIVTALTIAAWKLLGWWTVLVVPVTAVLLLKFALGPVLRRLFMMPFQAKSAVLKDARAEVHGVVPTAAPARDPQDEDDEGDEDDGEAATPRQYYLVDVTIVPAPVADGSFSMWEPGELRLIAAEREIESAEHVVADDGVDVARVEVMQDGAWVEDEGMKYAGQRRLRLTVGVRPESGPLQFQYYFETFGRVAFPRVIAGEATAVG